MAIPTRIFNPEIWEWQNYPGSREKSEIPGIHETQFPVNGNFSLKVPGIPGSVNSDVGIAITIENAIKQRIYVDIFLKLHR